MKIGSIPEAIELYAEKEDWEKVHELARLVGQELEKEYSLQHARHCLQNCKVLEAISVLSSYGLPCTTTAFEICGSVASQLLCSFIDHPLLIHGMQELRTIIYNHVQDFKGSNSSNLQPAFKDFETMLLPITYMVLRLSCQQQVDKSLLTRDCESCGSSIYEASLFCSFCKAQTKACCVTGYPLQQDGQVECQVCHMLANNSDWTIYVQAFQSCPWCHTSVQAFY